MRTWWRKEPLSKDDELLLNALFHAHHRSSFRDNASSVAVANSANSSQDMAKAIASGILTLGERHAPLEQTYHFLVRDEPHIEARELLNVNFPIPGWGGTFQKTLPDPFWSEVDERLKETHPNIYGKLERVTSELHSFGKKIYPNPSAYTAAVGMALGMHPKLLVYLFLAGRLDAWAKIAARNLGVSIWDSEHLSVQE